MTNNILGALSFIVIGPIRFSIIILIFFIALSYTPWQYYILHSLETSFTVSKYQLPSCLHKCPFVQHFLTFLATTNFAFVNTIHVFHYISLNWGENIKWSSARNINNKSVYSTSVTSVVCFLSEIIIDWRSNLYNIY